MSSSPISRPTSEAITYAFVAKAFNENRGAMHGLVPLFAYAIHRRAGDIFEPQSIATDLGEFFDLQISPLVVESLVPALLDEKVLEAVPVTGASILYRCAKAPAESRNSSTATNVAVIFERFRVFAGEALSVHGLEAQSEELDEALLRALTTSEMLQVSLRRDLSAFKGTTLTLKKESPVPDASAQKEQALAYLCGQFIGTCLEGGAEQVEALVAASWGALVSEVVLALQRPDAEARLVGLSVLVDGPILIDALELGEAQSARYALDLIDLLQRSGATVLTFEHLLEEMHGVIRAPLALIDQGQPASGPIAVRIKREPSHIERVRAALATLPARVSALGVQIVDASTYMSGATEQHFDEDRITGLRAWIAQNHFHEYVLRDLRDAQSVAYTMRLRGGHPSYSVSNAGYIFVTRNPGLVRATNRYLAHERLLPEYATPPCVSDQQLAGVAWFCTGGGGENLTRLKLAANCAVAVTPRTDLVSSVAQQLLDHDPERMKEFEALIRDDRASMCLMRETLGVASLATTENALSLLEKMRSEIAAAEYERSRRDIDQEKGELEARYIEEMASKDRQINALGDRLTGLEETARDYEARELLANAHADASSSAISELTEAIRADRRRRAEALATLRNSHQRVFDRTYQRVHVEVTILMTLAAVWLTTLPDWPMAGGVATGLVAFLGFWRVPDKVFGGLANRAATLDRAKAERGSAAMIEMLTVDLETDDDGAKSAVKQPDVSAVGDRQTLSRADKGV